MSHVLADASSYWHRRSQSHLRRRTEEARHRGLASPPMGRGERTLCRFQNDDGHKLLATDRALHLRIGETAWRRVPWADIAVVGWSSVECAVVLRLWPTCPAGPDVAFPANSAIAAFIDERVAATRVLVRHVQLRPGVIGTVVAVRDTDQDVIRWELHVAGGEPLTPELREIGDRVIAEIRGIAGC